MYKCLLKFESKEDQMKEYMINWAKYFGYDIRMEQWGKLWLKGPKFKLSSSLKDNFYNCWYMSPEKLSKMYKEFKRIYVGNMNNIKKQFTMYSGHVRK